MDTFGDPALRDPVSPFVQMLWERGTNYEKEVMTGQGMPFLDLSTLSGVKKEAATRAALSFKPTMNLIKPADSECHGGTQRNTSPK